MDILVNSKSHANTDYAKNNGIWQINNPKTEFKDIQEGDYIFIKTSQTNKVEFLGVVTKTSMENPKVWPVPYNADPNKEYLTIYFRPIIKEDFLGGANQAPIIYRNKKTKF